MEILILLIALSGGIALVFLGIIWFTAKLQKAKYENDYAFLSSRVRYWTVSPQTYHKIIKMFTELTLSKGNDPERTKELWKEFQQRFGEHCPEKERERELINQN